MTSNAGFTSRTDVTGTSVVVSSLTAGHQYEFNLYAVDSGRGLSSTAATVTQATSKCLRMNFSGMLLCKSVYCC